MITSLLPAWLETRICLRLRQHGLNPVYLVQCLFLLCPLFLCVAYSCAVVDEKRSHHWCDTLGIFFNRIPLQNNSLRIFCHWLQGHPIMETRSLFNRIPFQNNSLRIFCHWLQGHPIMETRSFINRIIFSEQQLAHILPLAAGPPHHGELHPGLHHHFLRPARL
jgi:hypothetical protein